jgi:hypothetical protein
MEIFATIGGVMTPENRMRLSKGLVQINQLARMVYPKTKDTNATVKVKHAMTIFTGNVKASENFRRTLGDPNTHPDSRD